MRLYLRPGSRLGYQAIVANQPVATVGQSVKVTGKRLLSVEHEFFADDVRRVERVLDNLKLKGIFYVIDD